MGFSQSGKLDDVLDGSYVGTTASCTTTPIEAKVGLTALDGREGITLYNNGPNTIYVGPSGSTVSNGMIPIIVSQVVTLNLGSSAALYMATSTGTSSVVIQEFS